MWDVETFDAALLSDLRDHCALIEGYIKTDREISDEYEKSDHTHLRRENPYADAFYRYKERVLLALMQTRTIRAWHYSRMTDSEVARMRQAGVVPSNLATIRARLDLMVAEGVFDQTIADHLYERSPFHDDPYGGRTNKFWMTSHPVPIDDGGVEFLLGLWGGESAAFTHIRGPMREPLSKIGRGRILEIAVPLQVSRHVSSSVDGLLSGFAASIGLRHDHSAFDLYAMEQLPPSAILAIHSEGEGSFVRIGNEYPARLIATEPPSYCFD